MGSCSQAQTDSHESVREPAASCGHCTISSGNLRVKTLSEPTYVGLRSADGRSEAVVIAHGLATDPLNCGAQ